MHRAFDSFVFVMCSAIAADDTLFVFFVREQCFQNNYELLMLSPINKFIFYHFIKTFSSLTRISFFTACVMQQMPVVCDQ